jgi:hypothetical protein
MIRLERRVRVIGINRVCDRGRVSRGYRGYREEGDSDATCARSGGGAFVDHSAGLNFA